MQLLLRKASNLIDLSLDGVSPCPDEIVNALAPHLTYQHKRLLHGADAYDPVTGQRRPVEITLRSLFTLEAGRLTTGAGFLPRIVRVLSAMGHQLAYLDVTPRHPRPNRYDMDWNNVHRVMQFRARQMECMQAIVTQPGGIIKAAAGFGKTALIEAACLLYPKARIDVVVRSIDIVERIVRRLSRHLPNVGQVGGGVRDWQRVTVVSADSLHHSRGDADILFGDECHILAADKFSELLAEKYRHSRNYGFSATPFGRKDGAHARLEYLYGPVIFELTYQQAVELGLVVPIFVHWLPIRLPRDINPAKGRNGVPRSRWAVWRNEPRNCTIAEYARTFPYDQQTLILVQSIEHAVYLWNHLPEYSLCYGNMPALDQQAFVNQGKLPNTFVSTTPQIRRQMQLDFEAGSLKKVIATDVWATGVDFTQLAVVGRVDERDSDILSEQGPSRASRIFEDEVTGVNKEFGTIFDCIDYFDPNLKERSRTRFRTYQTLGWSQDWPRGRGQISHADDPPAGRSHG